MASLDSLFQAAKAIQAKAYAPYSRFKVGAAIVTADGQVFTGCNVENAAYPVGSCAEAGAISAMIAGGGHRIAQIVVMGEGENLVTPCGGCRQRIREFAGPDTPIHIAGPEGIRRSFTLDELLPFSFGPDNLTDR
ncbi:cytidine deaminase [Microvirga lupini]|uniref:Cytidine deaminase n=1 Tax=Microvirga lupini TaxID=420324 RepID=A0A7W4YUM7_9HYPH|nr:cytidine deaminase [Microvirga lupini]MBB3017555.1 cytidine deaminase [Microvirga lupini]